MDAPCGLVCGLAGLGFVDCGGGSPSRRCVVRVARLLASVLLRFPKNAALFGASVFEGWLALAVCWLKGSRLGVHAAAYSLRSGFLDMACVCCVIGGALGVIAGRQDYG